MGIPPDEQRSDIVFEITDYGQLTAIQSSVPDADDAIIGSQSERNEVAIWACHDYFGYINSHVVPVLSRIVSDFSIGGKS